ncbi:MAG TPA: Rid family hydrolase [Thermoanaerobaculia bacterium]|nr:Rid family hydrolase [Thermoanaerobaculia bacterium]
MSSSISRPPAAATEHAVTFGHSLPGALSVPLRPLGGEPAVEVWQAGEGVVFGSIVAAETKPLEELSRDVYVRLISDVRAAGHPYFVRMWNYVGGINEYERDRERYQLFCAGRHDAFVDAGYHHDVDLPAASAVGMQGRGLIVYFLAAREAGVQVENPRQVAAYNYPPQYGPKSPSFSRATVWRDRVYVSGTSSVVGHATVHQGDVLAQLDETLRNIEVVLRATGRTLENVISAKTYVRNAGDYGRIAGRLQDVLPGNLFLEADICRKDLLLEIECVAR